MEHNNVLGHFFSKRKLMADVEDSLNALDIGWPGRGDSQDVGLSVLPVLEESYPNESYFFKRMNKASVLQDCQHRNLDELIEDFKNNYLTDFAAIKKHFALLSLLNHSRMLKTRSEHKLVLTINTRFAGKIFQYLGKDNLKYIKSGVVVPYSFAGIVVGSIEGAYVTVQGQEFLENYRKELSVIDAAVADSNCYEDIKRTLSLGSSYTLPDNSRISKMRPSEYLVNYLIFHTDKLKSVMPDTLLENSLGTRLGRILDKQNRQSFNYFMQRLSLFIE